MRCAASLSSSLLAGEDTGADSGFVATLQCAHRRGSLYGYCIINAAHMNIYCSLPDFERRGVRCGLLAFKAHAG